MEICSRLSSDKDNSFKKGQEFREISWHKCQCSGSSQIPRQDDFNNYHQFLSLYRVTWALDRSELTIYDAENEKEEAKYFDARIIDSSASITQLPNGELFCYGRSHPKDGITLIIDRNYGFRMLPSGTPCCWSSALYFDNNIYCFGGHIKGPMHLSNQFDLNKNRWIDLAWLPRADNYCHSVIFNRNILISALSCNNLWLYSIEIDSFSTIPYDFSWGKRKILINVEKLYLIEWDFDGLIYESEDEYHWQSISKSRVSYAWSQMYCLYNKEKMYISTSERYYYFDLKNKALLEFEA